MRMARVRAVKYWPIHKWGSPWTKRQVAGNTMTETKFEKNTKLKIRKWADDNMMWIVALIALSTLSIMACTMGSLLYGYQPAIMGVVATLAVFFSLLFVMIVRRCTLQGKVEEEPTIIQMAQEEALDGPPLFPHYQRRRSSIATIPRCSIPNMDIVIDKVRQHSVQGSQRRDSTAPSGSNQASAADPTGGVQFASSKKESPCLTPIAELPKTPTTQHIAHGASPSK
ncbi:uncharacterized protein LOC111270928 isoform X2 [Varroa jacobsoni]|uniref:uncharacterized protein LOC111270928 isoform X2 n=1 Tax=Varroa jacobsoni TaxID=62625 RepID=UPI000BF27FBD|nr:uncharacterized protein LOC111270928 isoform X2 [Varroa jacobsoni]